MGMSIDEAIKHAEEVGNGCNECAAEHRQLAEWLRKYQKIEEVMDSRPDDDAKSNSKALGEIEVIMYGNKD